jgi:hypothetical protein
MIFIYIVIIYCLILVTYVSGEIVIYKLYESNIDIFNEIIVDSYNYAKNVCGYHFLSSDRKNQEKFLKEALWFLKFNYLYVLKKVNMNNDEKLCQVIISKIVNDDDYDNNKEE